MPPRHKKYVERNREYVRVAKHMKPCADCGVCYPYYVMQYDHLRDKSFKVSYMAGRPWSTARLQEEIDKCDLVCANCHAERTFRRTNEEPYLEDQVA